LLRGDTLWTQANQIPGTAAATAGIVQAYTGANAVECTADNTTVPIGGVYPTWLTGQTYWIPSEFGSTYTAQVWIDNPGAANPTATGTQIFAAGSGGTGQYYYNYQSGVLNFIGETIPAALTSGKVLYIVGYRYIGLLGVTNLPSGTSIGNISITGSTIISKAGSNANITITPDGTGVVVFTKDISSTANISANNMTLTGNANVTGNINVNYLNANYLSGNGANITGVTASASDKLQNGNSNVSIPTANGSVSFNIADPANSNVAIANLMVLSSNLLTVNANITTTGTIFANNFSGNFSGNISGNVTIPGANTGVVFNDGNVANSSTGFTFDKTTNIANLAGNFNVAGNVTLGALAENQLNSSGGQLTINGGAGNASGLLTLFTGVGSTSAKIALSAASNSITTEADSFTFFNRANNFTLVTISNTSTVSTSTSTGALVANGGVGVSGNLFVGGMIGTTSNVTAGSLISPSLTSNTTILTLAAATTGGDNNVVLEPTGANGAVSVSSKKIVNLATPTLDYDAATKKYVDDVSQGLNIHDSAMAATTNDLATLTGGTITYNNGASGVGANLVLTGSPTANFTSANVFDGNVTLSATNRLLVKSEINAAYNGIYVVSNATVLTRADDYNSLPEIEAGDFVFVTGGTTYDNTGWVQTSTVVIVGTDPILFTQFSGAGTYTANNSAGLTLIGSQFNVKVDANSNPTIGFDNVGNLYVPAGAAFTTPNIGVASGTSVTVTGGVTANTLTANLTLSVTGNANVGNLGTTGLITATGNVSGGNITTAGAVTATGNGVFGNISTTGSGGNISGANVVSANTFTASGNVNATNLVANTAQISTGTITATNPAVNVTQTWNNASANFTGILENVTNTGSGAGSLLMDLQVGGVSKFSVSPIGNVSVGNLSTGSLSANTFTVNELDIGNTAITANTVTTTAITANQTIATYAITGTAVTGVEFLVKGHDTPGAKYSVATVLAVTDGNISANNVDYTIYGTVRIGTSTGVLAVNIDSGNIALQVTPSSSNSTTWTTQIRTI
jgi:filamentous hemagglutinin